MYLAAFLIELAERLRLNSPVTAKLAITKGFTIWDRMVRSIAAGVDEATKSEVTSVLEHTDAGVTCIEYPNSTDDVC